MFSLPFFPLLFFSVLVLFSSGFSSAGVSFSLRFFSRLGFMLVFFSVVFLWCLSEGCGFDDR